jgi:hypothetical protein
LKPSSESQSPQEQEALLQRSMHELNISQGPTHGSQQGPVIVIGSNQHQSLWEQGQIDFTGRDSFSNIQAHLDAQLNKK